MCCHQMRVGYACINQTLAAEKVKINRSMMKKTFLEKGLPYASELALKNITDLEKLVDWNFANGLQLYRMSSDMLPWMSEYEIAELPDIQEIHHLLKRIGQKVREHDQRLTYHPGPFNVLATNSEIVLKNTIKELRQHGEIMDIMGLPRTPFAKINIHVGGAYGNKATAIQRFIDNFSLLPETARTRLTVENDDRASMFSVKDLIKIHEATGIPVVFDYLHHQFCTGGLSEEEAMLAAYSTWPDDIVPVVHYSSAKRIFEDSLAREAAHADYVYSPVNNYDKEVDIVLEAKAKEKAVLQYLQEHR